jgi:hypothetical protein
MPKTIQVAKFGFELGAVHWDGGVVIRFGDLRDRGYMSCGDVSCGDACLAVMGALL